MPKDVNAAVATIKTKRTIQFVDSGLHSRMSLSKTLQADTYFIEAVDAFRFESMCSWCCHAT